MVWDSLQSQAFSLVTTAEPLAVNLDPGDWILADFTEQEVDVAGASVPAALHLAQNAPNPVNGSTTIRFGVARSGKVALRVFDAHGRLVRTLVQGRVDAGTHAAVWDGRDTQGRQVASGQYFYRLVSPQGIEERRLLVIR